jgi:hypothetical protein
LAKASDPNSRNRIVAAIFSRYYSNHLVSERIEEFEYCVENPWPQIKLVGVEAGLGARAEALMTGNL